MSPLPLACMLLADPSRYCCGIFPQVGQCLGYLFPLHQLKIRHNLSKVLTCIGNIKYFIRVIFVPLAYS